MKYSLVCALAVTLTACNPFPPTEAEEPPAPRKSGGTAKAAATPTPVPKPGEWMEKKKIGNKLGVKEDRLGVKGDRLDEKATKK